MQSTQINSNLPSSCGGLQSCLHPWPHCHLSLQHRSPNGQKFPCGTPQYTLCKPMHPARLGSHYWLGTTPLPQIYQLESGGKWGETRVRGEQGGIWGKFIEKVHSQNCTSRRKSLEEMFHKWGEVALL